MALKNIAGKAIVNIPAWAEAMNQGSSLTNEVTSPATAYAYVPLVYRAVRLRCDSLASVPLTIYRGETETDWPFQTDLYRLIWLTEAAMLLAGAAYWLKLKNRVVVKDLQWINPLTMEVDYRNGGVVFTQSGKAGRAFEPGEIVYFKEFNPLDDIRPGVSAAGVALNDAQTINYIKLFSNQFFRGGAMPITLLGIEGMTDPRERERVEGWFKQRVTGLRNAFRVLALSKTVKPEVLTQPMSEMAFSELNATARSSIADAFGIPQTMLEDAANYATASEHRLSFWNDTVKPSGLALEGVINRELLKPMGLRCSFDFDGLDVFKQDELEAAGALAAYVNAGYPLGLASEVVGIELPEDWEYADLDKLQKPEPEKAPETEPEPEPEAKSDNGRADLDKWQRKALKRLEKGQPAACQFESEQISPALAESIEAQLNQAQTAEDVRAIFAETQAPTLDLAAELKRANDLLEKTLI